MYWLAQQGVVIYHPNHERIHGVVTNLTYEATIDTPAVTDPVALDFKGLGKGHAWVNGKIIGRYLPSMLLSKDGCLATCDYVGKYSDSKCLSNYGNPSQRW
ncbi:Beta-galactosidase 7 [Ancistrocladus abbreviatus]